MKKLQLLILSLILCFSFGCKGNTQNEISNMLVSAETFSNIIKNDFDDANSGNQGRAFVNSAAVQAAFSLDFRPLKAEPVNEAETLSDQELAGAARSSSQGAVVGGGIRRLRDYRTRYFDPTAEAARIQEIRAAREAA